MRDLHCYYICGLIDLLFVGRYAINQSIYLGVCDMAQGDEAINQRSTIYILTTISLPDNSLFEFFSFRAIAVFVRPSTPGS